MYPFDISKTTKKEPKNYITLDRSKTETTNTGMHNAYLPNSTNFE